MIHIHHILPSEKIAPTAGWTRRLYINEVALRKWPSAGVVITLSHSHSDGLSAHRASRQTSKTLAQWAQSRSFNQRHTLWLARLPLH